MNFGIAGAALALCGPHWAVIAFLAVALVRIAMDAHGLRRDNELLQERVAALEGAFDPDSMAEDAPPASGARPTLIAARRAS